MSKKNNPVTQKSGLSTNVILTLVVVIVAVVVIGGVLLFNRGGGDSGGSGASQPPVAAEVLRKPDSHVLTEAPDGRVTMVEFLDYQCPSCHAYYSAITSKIEKDYAGKVTFVTRNYPLEMHPLAQPAARAAEAAALQGKYKEMYHALFDNYANWAVNGQEVSSDEAKANAEFEKYAQQIGLDVNRFKQDVASPNVQTKIDQDVADAKTAQVSGTPTIFVNGRQFDQGNAQTYADVDKSLRQMLDQELAK
ncbi:thioredoxin domain-containing protein [Saccharopolyspora sp. TS4A08]|uniref:Thioredoxin domain-containing protein n=1 Tax=Saccharopolyspora ipomoeae TaxID=3042027 RepID=A0ABT6PY28_9PSEU|nr:thioredoxin domain-containing protein [Saccharopolyspora sp. TS4A08]MDI2032767.1 thioredoxin domain-containing protein [Saccharopolyspora sp. TS4A08]